MNVFAGSSRYKSSALSANVSCSDNFMRSYRYQFNGQETDNELKDDGNSYDFGARMYDPRLGNVLAVVSDIKMTMDYDTDGTVDGYLAKLVSSADYSPFGVQLDGRTISSSEYRYGFQGQESDDEIKGEGNSVNYKYRMHDPRVGKFFAVDPLTAKYPNLTPYQFSSNSPIYYIELEGLEGTLYTYKVFYNEQGRQSKVVSAKVVEGLKYDVVKSVVMPYNNPNGKVHHLEYDLRNPDGHKAGVMQDYSLDNKPTVAQLNKVFSSMESNIPVKTETPQKSSLPVWLNEGYFEGGADAGNSGDSDWTGTKGARRFSNGVNNIGIGLQFTGIGAPLGRGFCLFSDIYDTALDYDEFGAGTAALNGAVRIGTGFLGGKIDSKLTKAPYSEVNKQLIKGEVNANLEAAEGVITGEISNQNGN